MKESNLMNQLKRGLAVVLVITLVFGVMGMPQTAYAKSQQKIEKVVTLTKNRAIRHKLSISINEEVLVKVELLSVKGEVEESKIYFGIYEFQSYQNEKMVDGGKGSFFSPYSKPKLKKSAFKAGKSLSTKNEYVSGKASVDWKLPKGLTKVKMRITYYTKSGRSAIKSLKEKSYKPLTAVEDLF